MIVWSRLYLMTVIHLKVLCFRSRQDTGLPIRGKDILKLSAFFRK